MINDRQTELWVVRGQSEVRIGVSKVKRLRVSSVERPDMDDLENNDYHTVNRLITNTSDDVIGN